MSFQAYIDSIQAKTGKTPDDFRALAAAKGLTKFGEVMARLKADFELGHGHANALAQLLVNADKFKAAPDDKLAALFAGDKARWQAVYDTLAAAFRQLGTDVTLSPNQSYINVQRGRSIFAILQPATADRFDIGIKRKGIAPTERFAAAGSWNNMVTHRVRIRAADEIDAELLTWLKQAYDALA